MDEKTRISFELGTSMLYLPSRSVTAPVLVPFTTTVTPGKVSPLAWDVTVPETLIKGVSEDHAMLINIHCSPKLSNTSLAKFGHGKGLHFMCFGLTDND